jgi:hypothetical protein
MTEEGGTINRRRKFAQLPDGLVTDARISANAVRVWARLDKYAGRDGRAFPARETLAEDIAMSARGVSRALAELIDTGWITRESRDGKSSVYVLNDSLTRATRGTGTRATRGTGTRATRGTGTRATRGTPPGPPVAQVPSRPGPPVAQVPGPPVAIDPGHRWPMKETHEGDPNKHLAADAADATDIVLVEVDAETPSETRIVQALVGAYADAWLDSAGVEAPARKLAAVGRNVKPLIAQGYDLPVVLLAVQRAGQRRNLDIDGQLGNARATYARGGQTRDALFEAWDQRVNRYGGAA